LSTRRRVQADSGGRGQIEAFGATVNGHTDRSVSSVQDRGRQTPRLVAEEPCGRAGQHGRRLLEGQLSVAVGRDPRANLGAKFQQTLRRLRNPGVTSAGLSVLMRYDANGTA